MTAAELRRKAAEALASARQVLTKSESENRELTADEETQIADFRSAADSFERRAKKLDELFADPAPEVRTSKGIEVGDKLESVETEQERGRSMGDFLRQIMICADRNTSRTDWESAQDSLRNFYKSTYNDYKQQADKGNKEKRALVVNSGIAGGYTLPIDFRNEVMRYPTEQAIVRPRATIIPMNGLEIDIPQLDASTVPTGGSAHYGGVLMAWTGEETSKTDTEPTFKQARLVAHEVSGYCPVSKVLLQKSPISIDKLVFELFGKSVAREEDRAFFRGGVGTTATGRPLGIHGAPCLVTTADRGSSTAITFANATDMWVRMPPDYRANAVWVCSQAAEATVLKMTGTANSVFFPTGVYTANTGQVNSGAQGGVAGVMLYMRPVLVSSLLPALDTAGDFGFYDFSQYLIGDPGIMEVATSEHYLFRQNQVAFRLIHYVGGMPWPASALTLDDGTTTVSPFVVLGIH